MEQVRIGAACLLWGIAPGLMVAQVLGLGWTRLERVAAAPGLSLAFVAAAAYAAEFAGAPVTPGGVGALLLALAAVIILARRLTGQSFGETSPAAAGHDAAWYVRPAWLSWAVLLLPLVVLAALRPVTSTVLLPPTMDDGLDHANWFRLIYETRSLDPGAVQAPPLGSDGTFAYYPWGLHAWLAIVARTASIEPSSVLMVALPLVSAAVPLSIYAFTARLTGPTWPAIGAALASLLFWWVPYSLWGWGGYPLLAGAVAALPVAALALMAVDARHVAAIGATAIGAIGLLAIHPSQAMAALYVMTIVAATLAPARLVRWSTVAVAVVLVGLAAVALTWGGVWWEPLARFVSTARDVGTSLAGDARYAGPLAPYLSRPAGFPGATRYGMLILAAVGFVFACLKPRLRPFVTLHVAVGLLIPLTAAQTWATTFWYHAPERVWSLQYASLPALAALGAGVIASGFWRFSRAWGMGDPPLALAWPVALVVLAVPVYGPYRPWVTERLTYQARSNPRFTLTDRRVLADFAWMRRHLPRDTVLFNAPADWGVSLPFTGVRTVFWSGGYAREPWVEWNLYLEFLRRGDPMASQGAAILGLRGIRYVYAADFDPRLRSGGRMWLDPDALASVGGLREIYRAESGSVFEIRDEGIEWLGLRASDRLELVRGFYGIERGRPGEWRWTNGDAAFRVRFDAVEDSHACFVRVVGLGFREHTVRVGDEALALTPDGYRIPPARLAPVVEVAILSPTTQHADDPRALGVNVTNLGIGCRADVPPATPADEVDTSG